MDPTRFDALARELGTTQTRRGTLRRVLAGLGALAGTATIDLAAGDARKRRKRKRRRRRCRGGRTRCGGRCVDTQSDPRNCGFCFKDCDDDEVCRGGECERNCGSLTLCGDDCVDTDTDPDNCGGCGRECPSGDTCTGGNCTCGDSCDGCCDGTTCVPIGQQSNQQCGSDGAACAACGGELCIDGRCLAVCDEPIANQTDCICVSRLAGGDPVCVPSFASCDTTCSLQDPSCPGGAICIVAPCCDELPPGVGACIPPCPFPDDCACATGVARCRFSDFTRCGSTTAAASQRPPRP